jgi:CRP/FNR family transcriptional regulator, cyclic AMP receptor protein
MPVPDATLASAVVFSGVPHELLWPLLNASNLVDYRDDAVIFSRGAEAKYVYLVLSGLVRICTMSDSGKRITVEIFKAVELFGELGVIDDKPRSADAIAMGPTKVAVLPGASFRTLMQDSPVFTVNLLRIVTRRLRRTYSLFEDASLSDLEHRLARQVLYLVGLGAVGERRVRLFSRMNQSDLADLLGTTQRSIITILNKWRSDGLAEFDGKTAQLTIVELERFKAMLEI